MFLSFLRKNATELEILYAIKARHILLPFSTVLGFVLLYSQYGKDQLNSKIKHFTKDSKELSPTILKSFLDSELSFSFRLLPDVELIQNYIHLFEPNPNIDEKLISKADLMHWSLLLLDNNEPMTKFTTPIVNICKSIDAIECINKQDIIMENLPKYIKFVDNSPYLMSFSSTRNLKSQIIERIISKNTKKVTAKFEIKEDKNKSENAKGWYEPQYSANDITSVTYDDIPSVTDNDA
jgi:hypothetical protein